LYARTSSERSDPVELDDGRRLTTELHQDVVALFALVDLKRRDAYPNGVAPAFHREFVGF